MRCKSCNTEIEEYEIFCDECKKELKKVSSRRKLKELEELIEKQSDLENTKELPDLNFLVDRKLNNDEIKEETEEEVIEEFRLEDKNKTKKIIILVSIFLIITILVVGLLMFLNKEEKAIDEEVIDYEKVINEYGKSTEKVVKKYLKDNEEIPTWQQTLELLKYTKYEVLCNIHNIYKDGSIYLSACKVNDESVKYTYGVEKEEKEGKKIEIYKSSDNNLYTNIDEDDYSLVGIITCKTEECEFISAYDNYVIIKEEEKYYLYDYQNNALEFGPFNIKDNNTINSILTNGSKLYGIYYNEDDKNNLYAVDHKKTFKNIKGDLVNNEIGYDFSIMYPYNYVIFHNDNKYNFVNLKTGNVSYSIKGNIGTFIEDKDNKLVYITVYDENYNKFKVYNSNGKLMFDGKEVSYFIVDDKSLIIGIDNSFTVYDKNLKVKYESKALDSLLGLYNDFVVVTEGTDLKILNMEGKSLAIFKDGWDKEKYTFNKELSGASNKNDKNGIYLTIEDKSGSTLEYYYIYETGETGINKKN